MGEEEITSCSDNTKSKRISSFRSFSLWLHDKQSSYTLTTHSPQPVSLWRKNCGDIKLVWNGRCHQNWSFKTRLCNSALSTAEKENWEELTGFKWIRNHEKIIGQSHFLSHDKPCHIPGNWISPFGVSLNQVCCTPCSLGLCLSALKSDP